MRFIRGVMIFIMAICLLLGVTFAFIKINNGYIVYPSQTVYEIQDTTNFRIVVTSVNQVFAVIDTDPSLGSAETYKTNSLFCRKILQTGEITCITTTQLGNGFGIVWVKHEEVP